MGSPKTVKIIHKGENRTMVPPVTRLETDTDPKSKTYGQEREVIVEEAYELKQTLPPGTRIDGLVINRVHEVEAKRGAWLIKHKNFQEAGPRTKNPDSPLETVATEERERAADNEPLAVPADETGRQ